MINPFWHNDFEFSLGQTLIIFFIDTDMGMVVSENRGHGQTVDTRVRRPLVGTFFKPHNESGHFTWKFGYALLDKSIKTLFWIDLIGNIELVESSLLI